MSIAEEIADDLARETLALAEASGDEGIVDEVAKVIGASSTTMEEAFLTAVRVRRAEARARDVLATAKRSRPAAPAAPASARPRSGAPTAAGAAKPGQ